MNIYFLVKHILNWNLFERCGLYDDLMIHEWPKFTINLCTAVCADNYKLANGMTRHHLDIIGASVPWVGMSHEWDTILISCSYNDTVILTLVKDAFFNKMTFWNRNRYLFPTTYSKKNIENKLVISFIRISIDRTSCF